MRLKVWKLILPILLLDVALAEDVVVNVSPKSIIGEWAYDMYRSRLYSLEVDNQEVDEQLLQKLRESVNSIRMSGHIPLMTITEAEIITHGNDYNKERITPYRVIGGNSVMVTVEVDRGPWKHVLHIHVDNKGIYFAPPDCETYPEQCQQMKTEYLAAFGLRVNSAGQNEALQENATATNTISAATSGSLDVDEMWERHLKERHYFVPVSDVDGN